LFWVPENTLKTGVKCKFLLCKIILLSSRCKLQKREFVKTVMPCACVLGVQSVRFLYKVT